MNTDETGARTLSLRLEIRGRVQGVGYRYFCQRRARELGLYGWAENKYDGSVEVCVSGPEDAVSDFIDALAEGPRLAVVESVTRHPVTEQIRLSEFDIR